VTNPQRIEFLRHTRLRNILEGQSFRDARPAEIDSNGDNKSGIAERQVASVAVSTMTDALTRVFFVTPDGNGLRGGTFHAEFGNTWTIPLKDPPSPKTS
jgi:hypothetical protein